MWGFCTFRLRTPLSTSSASRANLWFSPWRSRILSPQSRGASYKPSRRNRLLPARYSMPGLYGQVTEACHQAGFVPKAVQKDVWLMQTIVGLVAGGIRVALVPASLRNLYRRGVVYKSVHGLSPTVELDVVWRRDDSGAVLDSFLQMVGESFQNEGSTRDGQEQPRSIKSNEDHSRCPEGYKGIVDFGVDRVR